AGRVATANAGYRIVNQGVTIRSNVPMRLTEQVAPARQVEVDLSARRYVKIGFSVPQKRVTLRIFGRSNTAVSARAPWQGGVVDTRTVNIAAGATVAVVLRFDSIDEVVIDGADAL